MDATKILPLCLFLAACASTEGPLDAVEKTDSGGVLIHVMRLDLAENSYELVPSGEDVWFASTADMKQAMRSRAAAVCGAGGIQFLDVERPYYIQVELSPRGYVHCH